MIKYINTYMIYAFLALFGFKSIESATKIKDDPFKKTLTVNLKSESKTLSYLSVDNPNSANGTAVLFFVGASPIGGIWKIIPTCAKNLMIYAENLRIEQVDELNAENLRRIQFDELNAAKLKTIEDNKLSNISKFIMVQWPGVKLDGYESDPIEDSSLALVKEDMEILKQLKKENKGRLHVVGFSWGGLRAMTAYLSLLEEDREGISLSLIDPFIPTLATGEYDVSSVYRIRRMTPNYILNKVFNKIMSSNEAAVIILIKHCWAQEKEMRKKLQGINGKILDIRGIYLMTSKNGLARSRKYTEFFRDQVIPKCLIENTNDYKDIFFTHEPGFPVLINHEHLFFPDNPKDFLRSINQSLNNDFYTKLS